MLQLLCVAAVVEAARAGYSPPRQTAWQRKTRQSVVERAAQKSAAAEPLLLERLGSPELQAQLDECCPDASKRSARERLKILQDEMAVVEVISAFEAQPSPGNTWASMSVADGLQHSFFENQWQVGVLHHRNYSGIMEEFVRVDCAADGSAVTFSSWLSSEACSGPPSSTVSYPQGVCQEDTPGQPGLIEMHVCNGTHVLLKAWTLDALLPRPGLGGAGRLAAPRRPGVRNVTCPRRDADFELPYPASGQCSRQVRNWGMFFARVEDDAEILQYGLKPFAAAAAPSSLEEASERVVYAMLNTALIDAGSILYGDVSVVLSQRSVRELAVVSGIDTGSWESFCNASHSIASFNYSHNCSASTPFYDLGDIEHFNHLFAINEGYWSGADSIARRFARLEGSWGHVPVVARDFYMYFEAVQMGNAQYPHDVRFVIGTFGSLFGSATGARLQSWCMQNGWVLVWSLGANLDRDVQFSFLSVEKVLGNRSLVLNTRLVDPLVARQASAGLGLPLGGATVAAFQRHWERAESLRGTPADKPATWARQWKLLEGDLPVDLRVRPLRAGDCDVGEGRPECVGVSGADRCLCYTAPPESEILV